MEPNQMNSNPTPPVPPTPPTAPERHWRPRSIVGPVILILLGAAFLVNNLGILSFNVWEMMWKLWPVWLIAAGLDMMLGRRTAWGSWVVLGLIVAVIGGAVWAGNAGIYFGTGDFAGPAETINISEDLNGAQRANIQINSSVGELRLNAMAADNKLVEGYVNRLNGERIDKDAYGTSGDVTFVLKSQGVSLPGGGRNAGRWDLKLAKNVPTDLKLGTGIGEANIDLTGMTLTNLDVSTGIGEVNLTLPDKGNFHVTVKSGIGQSTLRIPQGMAAKIRAAKGIGAINVYGNFTKQDGYWVTSGYDTAENRVEVEVNGGIGEIEIRN